MPAYSTILNTQELPYVIYQKVKKFTITPYKDTGGELEEIEEVLDVDGELKGCTPFTCEVIPQVPYLCFCLLVSILVLRLLSMSHTQVLRIVL